MDRAVFDRMAEIDNEHWWFAARRDIIARLIERQAKIGRPLRILEVGCGTGSNLELLKRYGTVDAIEPDDPARALASARRLRMTAFPLTSRALPLPAPA